MSDVVRKKMFSYYEKFKSGPVYEPIKDQGNLGEILENVPFSSNV
jgi:hypothetical protein